MCLHSRLNDGFYGSLTTFEDRKAVFVLNMTRPFNHIYSAGAFADSHYIVLLLEDLFAKYVSARSAYLYLNTVESIECTLYRPFIELALTKTQHNCWEVATSCHRSI